MDLNVFSGMGMKPGKIEDILACCAGAVSFSAYAYKAKCY